MHFISAASIIIPENRQRKAFPPEKNEELKQSLQTKGILNPITLRSDGKTLVAGERRLRAMIELHQEDKAFTCNSQLVPSGQIPFTFLGELSELEIEEAELEENIVRLDISWQEKALAIARLQTLRQQQAAEKGESHTTSDLIEELTGTREGSTVIRDTLHIAKYLDVPEVAKAKTQKEATQIIKKKLELEHRQRKAEEFKKEKSVHDIMHGDSLSIMNQMGDTGLFNLLLTDPPYGVNADNFGSQAGVEHNYKDTLENALHLYEQLAIESFRLCAPEAHAYVFCDFSMFQQVSLSFSLAGWEVWPKPLIWSKRNGMLPRPEHGPRYTYEVILYAIKGNKKTLCVKPDILDYGQVQNQLHAAEKPVDLLRDLISRSCVPGDTILDPFAGSGSTMEAAFLENCLSTSIELNSDNYNICLERRANLELEI